MFTNSKLTLLARVSCTAVVIFIAPAHFSGALAAQDVDNVTVAQLREALAERDAVIVDLFNRVRALEEGRVRGGVTDPARDAERDESPPLPVADIGEADPRTQADLEIDALQAERALERGLVREGARLLTPGQIEFAPEFAVSRHEGMFPTALMVGDDSLVGEVERTFDVYEGSADLRIGLPLNAQLDIGLPYRVVNQEMKTGLDGAVQSATDQSGSGFADIEIGLAKVLATEQSWRPNIIGRVVWLTGSGDERDGAVFLGGGKSGLAGRLSAYWRRDPVVFLMSGGYTYYEEDNAIQSGDSFDLSIGLGLAVSPETALIFSLDQTLVSEFKSNGVELPGTDRLSSNLLLSASTILGRRLFLRVNAGVGLTEDAPDYRFGISLSSRFDAR